jgi:hypothetical protein
VGQARPGCNRNTFVLVWIGMSDDMEVARGLLAKVRTFVRTQLTDEESEMFAGLLAPGVAQAYNDDGDDVTGFQSPGLEPAAAAEVEWRPQALAASLREALREGGVRVVGLDE